MQRSHRPSGRQLKEVANSDNNLIQDLDTGQALSVLAELDTGQALSTLAKFIYHDITPY